MHTKASIFNLALNALLLQRRIVDADTDSSNEAKVLRTNWDVAFWSTLEDLDLDSTSVQETLALVATDPNDDWGYAYKYPVKCAFFRRILSGEIVDNRTTHIPKIVRIYNGERAIFTNEAEAVGEFISADMNPNLLSAQAGMAVALRLARMSSPLITGKGAQKLMESLEKQYIIAKTEAQEQDRRENFNYVDEAIESEFVEARTR